MSSFSCPHLAINEFCERLKKDCVPGRKGCVLSNKVVFAVPVSERIKNKENKSNDKKS